MIRGRKRKMKMKGKERLEEKGRIGEEVVQSFKTEGDKSQESSQ